MPTGPNQLLTAVKNQKSKKPKIKNQTKKTKTELPTTNDLSWIALETRTALKMLKEVKNLFLVRKWKRVLKKGQYLHFHIFYHRDND